MNDELFMQKVRDYQMKEKVWRLLGLFVYFGLPIFFIRFILFDLNGAGNAVFDLSMLGVILVLLILFAKRKDKQGAKIKELIGNYLVKDIIGEQIELSSYEPNGWMSGSVMKGAGVLPDYDKIKGSDHICGKYRGHEIEYCDLKLEREVEDKDENGHTSKHDVTVFQGQVIRLSLGKSISGTVQVFERDGRRRKGILSGIMHGIFGEGNSKEIEMENEAFNQQFKVLSDDPHLAFYVLTPAFMEEIVQSDRRADAHTNFCFREGHVTISLNSGHDDFEINKVIWNRQELEKRRKGMRQEWKATLTILDELMKNEFLFD